MRAACLRFILPALLSAATSLTVAAAPAPAAPCCRSASHAGSHAGRASGGHSSKAYAYPRAGGGHYAGGSGSSHKGGHYKNPASHDHYRSGSGSAGHAPRLRTPHPVAPDATTPRAARPHVAKPKGAPAPRAHSYAAPLPGTPPERDARGRFARSGSAKERFMRATGHPHGWPGHVVDHVVPLACGGADAPSNMQWQTVEEGRAKDRVERRGCARTH